MKKKQAFLLPIAFIIVLNFDKVLHSIVKKIHLNKTGNPKTVTKSRENNVLRLSDKATQYWGDKSDYVIHI